MKQPQSESQFLREAIDVETALTRELCKQSLYHFTKTFWSVIEPTNTFVEGWHIQAICDHLEAASRFEIKRLIVNMPPRHMKSILVSVMFPAWVWVNNPERRFIFASYAQNLTIRDGVKMRSLIESPAFTELFNPEWKLRDDQNQKIKFENTSTGFRFSTSVDGAATGEGGDFVIVDDPINVKEGESEPHREAANTWWDQTMSTRSNNPNKFVRIIVMQRVHENDLTGHVLEKERLGGNNWDRLILPARYEPKAQNKSRTTLGWADPRINEGDLLWPERFDEQSIKEIEIDLGDQASGQLQQDPKPRDGGLFKRMWWQWYEAQPSPIIEKVQFWDCAEEPGLTNDYSVCATWVRTPTGYYLLDVLREKVDAPTLELMAKTHYAQHMPDAVVIEKKSGGTALYNYLLRETTMPVLPFNPGKLNKVVRAIAATPTVKAKKCFLPKGKPFVEDFVKEHEKFPKVSHDDQVDTTSMAIEHFARRAQSEPRVRVL